LLYQPNESIPRKIECCLRRTRHAFRHWKVMHRTSRVSRFIPNFQSFSLDQKMVRDQGFSISDVYDTIQYGIFIVHSKADSTRYDIWDVFSHCLSHACIEI